MTDRSVQVLMAAHLRSEHGWTWKRIKAKFNPGFWSDFHDDVDREIERALDE